VDGLPATQGWPLDRGLQYGDGLFETMLVRAGKVRFEALHRARLEDGCRRLAIAADHDAIWSEARGLAAKQGAALLKLQVTRGDAVARGYTPDGSERARRILSVFPAPAESELPQLVRVQSLTHTMGENPRLAGLKHCNRLEQVLARMALRGTGAFEGIMASSSGLLISGTMSNVFVEMDGELLTPALDRCGIAGVMRAVVLREARRAQLPLRSAELPFEVVGRVTGMALSNARLGLLMVHELDGRRLAGSDRLLQLGARVAGLED
jgi:4-amino-4-deoxychorismate lyase